MLIRTGRFLLQDRNDDGIRICHPVDELVANALSLGSWYSSIGNDGLG